MKARKIPPAIAARLREMCAKLDRECDRLIAAEAANLAAARTEAEARVIVDRIVLQIVEKLDAEAIGLGLPPDYYKHSLH